MFLCVQNTDNSLKKEIQNAALGYPFIKLSK